MFVSSYNPLLVLFSLLVAILASYTALDLAGRISTAQGRAVHWWLAGGACAMGIGIWSMHFIGMLAFNLPIPLGYDLPITLVSLLIAIASSAFALWLVCQATLPWLRLCCGAVLLGSGVAAMHYTGMAAMRMTPAIEYTPSLFILSIVIAVTASGAALWAAFTLRRNSSHVRLFRLGAALVMGIAICGMHYTGMAAAQFPLGSVCSAAHGGAENGLLPFLVIIVTLAVLAITLIVSVLDMRMESRTKILASSLAEANKELLHLALHDSLTKLPNRVLLEDRLDQAIRSADREQSRFAVMFMDLDGFKGVNDAFGHHLGDELLVEVARRVRACVRSEDTIARVGGDEFVLLASVGDPSDAATIADKITASIEEVFDLGGQELRVSTSVGIAMYPGNGPLQEDLLRNADAAMYHAKALGRHGYCFFEDSMNVNVQERHQLLRDLRSALARNELRVFYQPKFDGPTGKLIGAEALLRWEHPTRGMVMPDQFISSAEKSGLIVQIGEWVLDEACRQMRAWHDQGNPDWTIAVNLSALQFAHPELIVMVRTILARHKLAPRCLTLEITESTAMFDVEASLETLQQLHALGVKISIDDFGTGYSSLLYLKRLSASELKIDRGFVRDLANNAEDAAIVTAIVALGHTLKLKVVAEGVETSAQHAFLTDLGCDSLQGYLFGQPMAAHLFIEAAMREEALIEKV